MSLTSVKGALPGLYRTVGYIKFVHDRTWGIYHQDGVIWKLYKNMGSAYPLAPNSWQHYHVREASPAAIQLILFMIVGIYFCRDDFVLPFAEVLLILYL